MQPCITPGPRQNGHGCTHQVPHTLVYVTNGPAPHASSQRLLTPSDCSENGPQLHTVGIRLQAPPTQNQLSDTSADSHQNRPNQRSSTLPLILQTPAPPDPRQVFELTRNECSNSIGLGVRFHRNVHLYRHLFAQTADLATCSQRPVGSSAHASGLARTGHAERGPRTGSCAEKHPYAFWRQSSRMSRIKSACPAVQPGPEEPRINPAPGKRTNRLPSIRTAGQLYRDPPTSALQPDRKGNPCALGIKQTPVQPVSLPESSSTRPAAAQSVQIVSEQAIMRRKNRERRVGDLQWAMPDPYSRIFLQSSDLNLHMKLTGRYALFSLVSSVFTIRRCQSVSRNPARLLHDLVTLPALFRQPKWKRSTGMGGKVQWTIQQFSNTRSQVRDDRESGSNC